MMTESTIPRYNHPAADTRRGTSTLLTLLQCILIILYTYIDDICEPKPDTWPRGGVRRLRLRSRTGEAGDGYDTSEYL